MTDLLRQRRLWICLGSGGVGKTTLSATLGLQGAQLGKRVLVLTIDPARRLADALGVKPLHHQVQRVPLEATGSLDIMMVEQKPAFDEVVHRYVQDPAHAHRLFHNPLYQQISGTLPGAHEYAAMSVLYDWAQTNTYDWIVLDTPPMSHALDFLEAPEKILAAVASPALQWLVQTQTSSSRWLSWGGTWALRILARFLGADFLKQISAFLADFAPIVQGLEQRAKQVQALLQQADVGFLLVCSPKQTHVQETQGLLQRLQQRSLTASAVVVNRVHDEGLPLASMRPALEQLHTDSTFARMYTPSEQKQFVDLLTETYQAWQIQAQQDRAVIDTLRRAVQLPVFAIPHMSSDTRGLNGLWMIAQSLG